MTTSREMGDDQAEVFISRLERLTSVSRLRYGYE